MAEAKAKRATPYADGGEVGDDFALFNSLYEFRRKFGADSLMRNRIGFNAGGAVGYPAGATRGVDSVRAGLTPGEYVLREPAVQKYGIGFLDTLNNLKMPSMSKQMQLVANSMKDAGSRVVHALDLTINGSHIGEVAGPQATVESFIEAMKLAQARTA